MHLNRGTKPLMIDPGWQERMARGKPAAQEEPPGRGPNITQRLRLEISQLETRLRQADQTTESSLQSQITELKDELAKMKGMIIQVEPNPSSPPIPDPSTDPTTLTDPPHQRKGAHILL